MTVRLLGTGSADGWPNPFCTCASCTAQRADGVLRGQTSALVGPDLLLDPGPEAAAAATRLGVSLAGVRHVLVTHAHVDHVAPQLLLFRSWARDEPLDVVGPVPVLEEARRWVAPDAPVHFLPVSAGDLLTLGRHEVRVLPAAHQVAGPGDAVLYDVTSAGPGDGPGSRLLWACDTGPWPDAWLAAVEDAAFDVVLLEETFGLRDNLGADHLHLGTFAALVADLRRVGAVTDATDVVAVHLSHHNPAEAELVERLRRTGARPGRDGDLLVPRDVR